MAGDAIYIFLDEGGNFDFSEKGTKYFTLTSVLKRRPFNMYGVLTELRFDLIEDGLDIEYFHATEDRQFVRNLFFEALKANADRFLVDSIVVEKRKTNPALRPPEKFYPQILGYLLRYVVENIREDYSELREMERNNHPKKIYSFPRAAWECAEARCATKGRSASLTIPTQRVGTRVVDKFAAKAAPTVKGKM